MRSPGVPLAEALPARLTHRFASAAAPSPAVVIAISAAMFAVVLSLKLLIQTPGFGFPLLYDIPVALVAIAFGLRAGLAAVAVGMVLYAIGDSAGEIHSNAAGYASRALTFVLLAALLGLFSDRLRRGERRFRALLESAPDAIVAVDDRGRIALVNAQIETMFGYSRPELVGKPVEILIPSRFHQDHERHRDGYFEHARVRPMGAGLELFARRKDGTEFPVEISLSPLETEEGTLVTAAVRDVTERKRAEQAQPLAAIVESSQDAIVGKTLEGKIVTWNTGAERLYGYRALEAIGEPISMLVPADRADEVPAILGRIRQGESVEHYETARCAKDGRRIDVSLTISPIRDEEGRITGAAAIARDVTKRKRAEEQLRRVSAELELRVVELAAANDELEAFSYSVSHDLRAPLRAMDGFSRALIEDYGDALDQQGHRMLERVRAGSQRMGQLIDELLALSQLSRKALESRRVDLSEMARELAAELQTEDPERQVELVVEEGLSAEGDPELLRVVLANLLQNAWKFTAEREQPRIEFRRERANGHLAYVVRDNGAGFEMRYADKLFRPFERLHAAGEYPGIGVGLATVNRVVRRHGGRVWAEGRVGEGAAFFFDLADGERE